MKGIEGFTLGRYELRRRVAQGGMARSALVEGCLEVRQGQVGAGRRLL